MKPRSSSSKKASVKASPSVIFPEKKEKGERGFSGSLGRITCELLEPLFQKKESLYSRLLFHWPLIVGDFLAQCTRPNRLSLPSKVTASKEGVLYLDVLPSFSIEAPYKANEIIHCINNYLGYQAISKIFFRQTQWDVPSSPSPSSSSLSPSVHLVSPRASPAPAPVSHALRQKLDAVEEENLRQSLESLWKNLYRDKAR